MTIGEILNLPRLTPAAAVGGVSPPRAAVVLMSKGVKDPNGVTKHYNFQYSKLMEGEYASSKATGVVVVHEVAEYTAWAETPENRRKVRTFHTLNTKPCLN